MVLFAVSACERKASPPPAPAPVTSSSAAVARGAPSDVAAGERPHPQFERVDFPEVPIRAGATTTVRVAWKAPPGTGVNEEAPFKVRWSHSDALAEAPADVKATGTAARDGFRINVKPLDGAPNATLSGMIDLVVCDMANHSICVPVRRKLDIEFVVGKSAPSETVVMVDLPQAKAM
jgi:hypothetical protein